MRPSTQGSVRQWQGECLRKKPLKEAWADKIIKRAGGEGTVLHKYYCPHCQHWHVTKVARGPNGDRAVLKVLGPGGRA